MHSLKIYIWLLGGVAGAALLMGTIRRLALNEDGDDLLRYAQQILDASFPAVANFWQGAVRRTGKFCQ